MDATWGPRNGEWTRPHHEEFDFWRVHRGVVRVDTQRRPMVLPLSLLRAAKGQALLVELKNGETYNGTLVACDNYMNLTLSAVVCTSRDADTFHQIASVYIRGITIKYLCVPQETMALVKETSTDPKDDAGKGRGRGRGRGRGADDQQQAGRGGGGKEKRGRQ